MKNYLYNIFARKINGYDFECVCSESDSLKLWIELLEDSGMIIEYCILHGNEDFDIHNAPWYRDDNKKITPRTFFRK